MGRLNASQENAAKPLLPYDTGVFVAPPGTGKTVLAKGFGTETDVASHKFQAAECLGYSRWIRELDYCR
jgi:AAA+ superfamily predicted ATPase